MIYLAYITPLVLCLIGVYFLYNQAKIEQNVYKREEIVNVISLVILFMGVPVINMIVAGLLVFVGLSFVLELIAQIINEKLMNEIRKERKTNV